MLFLILASIGVGYYFAVTKDTALQPEKLLLNEQTVVIYDRYGDSLKNVSTFTNNQTVKIEEIPREMQLAVISTEDKRFYKHNGFDVRRIARAALNNVKAKAFKEGASTISQQLIKNTHLTQEKTVKRKLKEWKLTRKLEHKYTKQEILEKYLNTIYFGHSCFGIRAAAEFYFGKTPSELTLADSAILAGLIKSPNNYSPFKHPENCQKRKAIVLSLMQKNGYIHDTEKETALHSPLPTAPPNTKSNNGFLTFVFDELGDVAAKHHLRLGGSIEIFTDFDPTLQERINGVCPTDLTCDKTIFVLDATSRLFKACYSTVGNVNRLPGSLIKPLLVYAPAIEEDVISPATPILDEKVNYGGYSPENYNGKYHGYVSARECLAYSLNIPAVKVLQSVGIDKSVDYLEKMGLQVEKDDRSLALALGGMKNGFPLRDILSAYATLQNGGTWQECGFISKIRVNGINVYEINTDKKRIFSEDTAYLTTDMLKTAAKEGTAKKLRPLSFDIAAKTGTVGNEKGNTDAYALSYTTRDIAAVWLGNADNTLIEHTGGGLPCSLLYSVNEILFEDYQTKNMTIASFSRPNGVGEYALDKTSYYDTHNILLADDAAPQSYRICELFKKDNSPTKKSDFFSNPSILPPTLQVENGKVIIMLDKHSPTIYKYKIERSDYATHTTIYEGEYLPQFVDDTVLFDKRYVYTVTPIYNTTYGTPITLPTVHVGQNTQDDAIIQKEWWQY